MKKILLADSLDKEAVDKLKSLPQFEVTIKTGMDEAELVKTIPGFHAVVVRSATKITRKVVEAATTLELIVRAGIGLDNVDAAAAKEKGIKVANTPAATTISVAEITFGLMLGSVRQLGRANLTMKEHKWEKKAFSGTELYGKTLGVIGGGRIGQAVAERALAFGMKVVVYDVIRIETKLNLKQVSLDELFAQADIITLHTPKQAKPILGREEFLKMKNGVIVVNAARGGVVDESALLEALKSGKVKSAALDVFEKEPPVDFALIDHPSVMASPHIGAAAEEGQKRAGLEVVRILEEKLA
ncbi:MAG: D-isomer specific 2-hydroxyacid dehydrogenase NAD-binding protein [Candidatus Aminicenantes bacterium]|nr:D-isomer specific 2-hydroxyacid dehydrogenase NAD-binding protein [Candidatus Aminicenantes bacterium]